MAQVADRQEFIPRAGAACKRAAEAVLKERKVVIALVDDATIAELHGRFMDDPTPTDVISFPHGEIVISAETALREAEARGIPPLHELVLYVVHGSLHLAGYDDRTPKAQAKMRAAERRTLRGLGLGDVFGTAPPQRPRRGRRGPSARARKTAQRKRKPPRNRGS